MSYTKLYPSPARLNSDQLVQDLRRHFEPWRVVSEKISRDEKTGVSKEVGFAR